MMISRLLLWICRALLVEVKIVTSSRESEQSPLVTVMSSINKLKTY